ncbi:hypothetical protein EB815_00285 [Mesorhizobium loti]|nr:hypothetical protein EB815_00285 [Mesorhizobium loti]QKC87048.1 hypothetical protein EB230_00285 [Mesorhizobium sp. NZP2234]
MRSGFPSGIASKRKAGAVRRFHETVNCSRIFPSALEHPCQRMVRHAATRSRGDANQLTSSGRLWLAIIAPMASVFSGVDWNPIAASCGSP